MKLRRVSLVLIAVACGAGLTACGTGPGTPTAESSLGSQAGAPSPGASGVLGILGITANAPRPSASRSRGTPAAHTSGPAGARATATGPSPSTHPTSASPATSASSAGTGSSGSGTASFTVPSIPGGNVVSAYGSYTKINAAKVKVTICAKQTGTAYSVGAIALAYNTSGGSKNVGAVVLTGPGNTSCGTITFLFYSAHLKVHAFIGGTNGNIQQTGPVLTLY